MSAQSMIPAFVSLGEYLLAVASGKDERTAYSNDILYQELLEAREKAILANPWFNKAFVNYSFMQWGKLLTKDNLENWLHPYRDRLADHMRHTVGVVMAGNLPIVGFHDFLCTLVSGNTFLGKLSSADAVLLPAMAKFLCCIDGRFNELINFTDARLSGFDAVIATGSNNTARYFEYYFGKYPHIIRHNRNGIAIVTGNEDENALRLLADDIFLYYGMGCRNVSKIFVPEGYEVLKLMEGFSSYADLMLNSHKYMNNYTYQRSILLMNGTPHFDNGFVLLTENQSFVSPVGVVHYEFYHQKDALLRDLEINKQQIQCIVTSSEITESAIPFGSSQKPGLHEYADGVDTLDFLLGLDNE